MSPAVQDRVERVLSSGYDQQFLSTLLGKTPVRCQSSPPFESLCEWHLSRRQVAWEGLAEILDTRATIAVICRLPAGEDPRAIGSCAAWPRRSNRSQMVPMTPSGKPDTPSQTARREKNEALAREWLDGAETVQSMTWLLGAVPTRCDPGPAPDSPQTCVWQLRRSHYGHGTVAASISARHGDPVSLRCEFPGDGNPRAADACNAWKE